MQARAAAARLGAAVSAGARRAAAAGSSAVAVQARGASSVAAAWWGQQHRVMWRAGCPQQRLSGPARGLALSAAELDKRMGDVNDLFVEARELLADALDSQGSTYFEDDLDDAQHAVKECLDEYESMLSQLDEQKRGEVTRSMGMKMEQLKGELNLILDSLLHDEELPTSGREDK